MSVRDGVMTRQDVPREPARDDRRLRGRSDGAPMPPIGKLSANVDAALYERLRELAHLHRVSESSIVDLALRHFFAQGDDEALGAILRESGATLRRKQSSRLP